MKDMITCPDRDETYLVTLHGISAVGHFEQGQYLTNDTALRFSPGSTDDKLQHQQTKLEMYLDRGGDKSSDRCCLESNSKDNRYAGDRFAAKMFGVEEETTKGVAIKDDYMKSHLETHHSKSWWQVTFCGRNWEMKYNTVSLARMLEQQSGRRTGQLGWKWSGKPTFRVAGMHSHRHILDAKYLLPKVIWTGIESRNPSLNVSLIIVPAVGHISAGADDSPLI
ncbi:hypothetical protein C8R44DRAFT_741433 [Mycena epipterygia]|nr:hypothetical protein C8R44DRAFT_741433 [Mycena epipterygia]